MAWAKTASRPRRPRRRDDRRRRAPGGPELRGAAGCGARTRRATSGCIVDRNELQSDKPTEEILALGDLEAKLARVRLARRVVRRPRSRRAARRLRRVPRRRRRAEGARREHDQGQGRLVHGASGARCARAAAPTAGTPARPTTSAFAARTRELVERIRTRCPTCGSSAAPADESVRTALEGEPESGAATRATVTDEYVADAYGDELLELAERHPSSSCSTPTWRRTAASGLSSLRTRSGSTSPASPSRTWSRLPRGWRARASCPVVNSFASLPRLARERADLQPGERAHEGRLRAPLRRPDPGRAREVAPERSRRLAARRAAEHDDRAAGELRGDAARCCAGPSRRRTRASRCGSRSGRRRAASSSAMPPSRRAAARVAARGRGRAARSPTGR